jgi:hypothetical protein
MGAMTPEAAKRFQAELEATVHMINAVEELDDLPENSIVVDDTLLAWQKRIVFTSEPPMWTQAGDERPIEREDLVGALPVLLVWCPE